MPAMITRISMYTQRNSSEGFYIDLSIQRNKFLADKGCMGKSHGFRGSLALRVLVISFVFVILPLVLYALLLFIKDYREEEEALFERLNYIQRSNEEYIFQLENSSVLFLQSLDKLLDIF